MNQQQQALSKLLGGAVDTGDSDSLQLPQIEEQRQTIANKRHDRESLVQQRNQLQVRLQQLEVQKDRLTLRAPEDGKVLKLLAKQGEIVQADTPVILLESKRQYYDIMSVKSRPSISMKARPWPVSPYPMASPLPGRSASSPRRRGLPI